MFLRSFENFLITKHFLTHFTSLFHVYNPWRRQKIGGFLVLSGGIEMEYLCETLCFEGLLRTLLKTYFQKSVKTRNYSTLTKQKMKLQR